jgi:hypothetical protein
MARGFEGMWEKAVGVYFRDVLVLSVKMLRITMRILMGTGANPYRDSAEYHTI